MQTLATSLGPDHTTLIVSCQADMMQSGAPYHTHTHTPYFDTHTHTHTHTDVSEVHTAVACARREGGKHSPYLQLNFLAIQVDGLYLEVYTCTTDRCMHRQTSSDCYIASLRQTLSARMVDVSTRAHISGGNTISCFILSI